MSESLLVETKEIGNHRIKIYYDEMPMCPCTDWDMAACYLWEYDSIARLSEECNWREVFGKYGKGQYSLIDALRTLIAQYVAWKDLLKYLKKGKLDNLRMRYERSSNMWYLEEYHDSRHYTKEGYYEIFSASASDIYVYDYTDEVLEVLDNDDLIQILADLGGDDIYVKEWSTTGYSQGDCVEGIAFCTKERYTKMVSADTTDWKTKIDALVDDEVQCIGMWMWGDVKGYVLEKKTSYIKHYQDSNRKDEECFDWEEVHSCWGFFMETEELIDSVIVEHNLKEVA